VLQRINPNEKRKTTMTDYEINVSGGILSSLLSEKNGLATLVEAVLNQVLEAQTNEQVGAQCYERSEGRVAYRSDSAIPARAFSRHCSRR
jgi:transposase-like protein